MRSNTARVYCAEHYKKTKKSSLYHPCYGSDEEIEKQRTQIRKLYVKRNDYYKNKICCQKIDHQIKQFDEDINKRKSKAIQQEDRMPLISLKTAPDLLIDNYKEAGSTCLLVGSSKRGKTHLLLKIWERYYKNKEDLICILISPSCNIPLYDVMSKNKVIKFNRYDKQVDALIKSIFKIQNITSQSYKFAFLIDDCVSSRYSPTLDALFLYARNLLISTVCCVQRETLISRSSRSSANNVICFGLNTQQAIKGCIEAFFQQELRKISGIKRIDDLIDEYLRLTTAGGGHAFLVYIPFKRQLKHYVLEI